MDRRRLHILLPLLVLVAGVLEGRAVDRHVAQEAHVAASVSAVGIDHCSRPVAPGVPSTGSPQHVAPESGDAGCDCSSCAACCVQAPANVTTQGLLPAPRTSKVSAGVFPGSFRSAAVSIGQPRPPADLDLPPPGPSRSVLFGALLI